MNAVASHHHNLKALAVIYGVSAAALLSLAAVVLIGCCYSRRRLFPPPPNPDGASDDDSVEIEAGLTAEIVKSYPKIVYRQFKIENGDPAAASSTSSCSICLAEYTDNDAVLVLPDCSHFFHVNCIDVWFKRHSTCPVCRKLPRTVESAGDSQRADPFTRRFVPFMQ